jgi:hypothetical protein
MVDKRPRMIDDRECTVADAELVYRVPNLSFCPLDKSVIVLDPKQGLYFRMVPELASLLQSIPEYEVTGNGNGLQLAESPAQTLLRLQSLMECGLVEQRPLKKLEIQTEKRGIFDGISVWGSVTELTQLIVGGPSM